MKNNRVDVAYKFLKEKGELVEFMEMYNELAQSDKRFTSDYMMISQLYTDIVIDGRFFIKREEMGTGRKKKEVHKCGVRENYTYDEIKESISKFGDVILDKDDEMEVEEEKVAEAPVIVKGDNVEETVTLVGELDDSPSRDIDDGEDD